LRSVLFHTFLQNRDLKTSFQQLRSVLAKQKPALIIFSIANPSAAAPQDFCRAHPTWQLPCHTIITHPATTHTYQIEKKDTKVSMLPNIDTSPSYNLPCLHTVESKNSQLPTEKKTCFFEKP